MQTSIGKPHKQATEVLVSFIDIEVPHGRLEALLSDVAQPVGAAVVCHPHPAHGGTMHNHVTYRLAHAWRDANVAALRFNFRGVGRSTGEYDDGVGELDDAAHAFAFLAHRFDGVPRYASGFSFGARTALQLAIREPRVRGVIAVGLPIDMFDVSFVQQVRCPVAFVHSDTDEFGALANMRELLQTVSAPHRLFVVPEADHLCNGRLEAFSGAAAQAVSWLRG